MYQSNSYSFDEAAEESGCNRLTFKPGHEHHEVTWKKEDGWDKHGPRQWCVSTVIQQNWWQLIRDGDIFDDFELKAWKEEA